MRRLLVTLGLCCAAALCSQRAAGAQPAVPNTTDVYSYAGWLQLSLHDVWRGFNRGTGGAAAGASAEFGQVGAQHLFFVASAGAQTAAFSRSQVSDLVGADVALVYQFLDDGSWFWLGADGYWLPSADTKPLTAEVGGGLRYRLPWWPAERHPLIFAEYDRDLVRYDANYVRGAIRLDFELPCPTWAAFIELGQALSNLPGGTATGSVPFGYHDTDLTFTVAKQNDPATSTLPFSYSIEPYVRGFATTRNAHWFLPDVGIRGVIIY
jgi:hypothetical protein